MSALEWYLLCLGALAFVSAGIAHRRLDKARRDISYLRADVRVIDGMLQRGHQVATINPDTGRPYIGGYVDTVNELNKLWREHDRARRVGGDDV